MPFKAHGKHFDDWFNQRLEQMDCGGELVYVVRRKRDQLILGATAYYDIHFEHQRLSLGFTWFAPYVWGTGVNHECKLLMLRQAFEEWNINRVEIGADPRNSRSVHAITKLGATKEGILRQHMRSHTGVLTDTIVFSILAPEWAKIKMELELHSNFMHRSRLP